MEKDSGPLDGAGNDDIYQPGKSGSNEGQKKTLGKALLMDCLGCDDQNGARQDDRDQDVRIAFSSHDQPPFHSRAASDIIRHVVIKDKFTGESRGFGFVEMPNKDEAEKAIAALNGKDLKGRNLTVNEARPRTGRLRTGGSGGGRRQRIPQLMIRMFIFTASS